MKDEELIYGFYECISNTEYLLTVRPDRNGLTLNFSDEIETSIENYWAENGQSILDPGVKARFQNGYEVEFYKGWLILFIPRGEILKFRKVKSIKGYVYHVGYKTYGWTPDDQWLYAFSINEKNFVLPLVSPINIPNLKLNKKSNDLKELTDEMTKKVQIFYIENQENFSNPPGELLFEDDTIIE